MAEGNLRKRAVSQFGTVCPRKWAISSDVIFSKLSKLLNTSAAEVVGDDQSLALVAEESAPVAVVLFFHHCCCRSRHCDEEAYVVTDH